MAAFVASAITFNTTAGNKTVAITPAVGELLIAVVAYTGTANDATVTDDRSGTYTRIDFFVKNVSADRIAMYVRDQLCTQALSHTLTMNIAGAGTGGGIAVIRISGMNRVGLNAIRQYAGQDNAGASTPAPAFAVAALTGNLCIGAVFNATNPATLTPRTGYTERHDVGYATPTSGLEIITRDSGETGTTQTWGSASGSAFGSMVIELDATLASRPRFNRLLGRWAHRFLTLR